MAMAVVDVGPMTMDVVEIRVLVFMSMRLAEFAGVLVKVMKIGVGMGMGMSQASMSMGMAVPLSDH